MCDWIKALCFLNLFLCLLCSRKEMRLRAFVESLIANMCACCVQFLNSALGRYNNKAELNLALTLKSFRKVHV